MVELVGVILVIAVLAAVALPRHAELRSQARIAMVQAMAGSIRVAASAGKAACLATPATCNLYARSIDLTYVMVDGQKVLFSYGAPVPYDNVNGPGINALVDASDFTLQPYVSMSKQAVFWLNDANDPSNCKVIYDTSALEAALAFRQPVVTVVTSGC